MQIKRRIVAANEVRTLINNKLNAVDTRRIDLNNADDGLPINEIPNRNMPREALDDWIATYSQQYIEVNALLKEIGAKLLALSSHRAPTARITR